MITQKNKSAYSQLTFEKLLVEFYAIIIKIKKIVEFLLKISSCKDKFNEVYITIGNKNSSNSKID